MLTVRSGPVVGLTSQVALLAALEAAVGLSPVGWFVGLSCGIGALAVVSGALLRRGLEVLGPADVVTLSRTLLACAVAALTVQAYAGQPEVAALVAIATVALVLDAVDGRLARRTRTTSAFGARFDGEADAFLILVLSVYVASLVGPWVLALGLVRYAFAVAGWMFGWMRRELPPRYWRKVVTATQGIVLTVVAAEIVPDGVAYLALAVAAVLLAESFGRDVWWLWLRRGDATDATDAAGTGRPRHPRARAGLSLAANLVAALLVWAALVVPNQTQLLAPGAFVRVPVEALVAGALVLLLPARARPWLAAVAGVLLGLLGLGKLLDMGFFAAFDRRFNPVTDAGYLGSAVELVQETAGPVAAVGAVVAAVLLTLVGLVGVPLALVRLARLLSRHRRRSGRVLLGLSLLWVACAVTGLQNGQGQPLASAAASRLAVGQVHAVSTGLRSVREFEAAAGQDDFRPRRRGLLGGLRGKDVLVVFVESYGRVALEGLPDSPKVRAVLDRGTRRLDAAGYSSRSAFLHSPTFGGLSWLAHATLQSGLWISDERRYQRLLDSDRTTLSSAFDRAGWRTVAVMPSLERAWPEGVAFYDVDTVYGTQALGYAGPRFGWSRMPDQFVLARFADLALARDHRRPVMAKIDLTSTHAPWTPLPRTVRWDRLGNGSVFAAARQGKPQAKLWRDADAIKAAYVRSLRYSLRTVTSFVERYGDDDLVLVLVGDHAPATVVSGHDASHDVPITVLAGDPAVVEAVSGWGWQAGLRPDDRAPAWRMDAFRDRFLAAYSPWEADPVGPPLPVDPEATVSAEARGQAESPARARVGRR